MRWPCLALVVAACGSKAADAPAPAPAAPRDAPALDEATCRALSHGKSCAEIEPELERLRADVARYMERQGEVMSLSSVVSDSRRSAAERRAACDKILTLVMPTESGLNNLPTECLTLRGR